jgi:hypothetical protein
MSGGNVDVHPTQERTCSVGDDLVVGIARALHIFQSQLVLLRCRAELHLGQVRFALGNCVLGLSDGERILIFLLERL